MTRCIGRLTLPPLKSTLIFSWMPVCLKSTTDMFLSPLSHWQSCFLWAPETPSPWISISPSLGLVASFVHFYVFRSLLLFSWCCLLYMDEGSSLTHGYSMIIPLHNIALMPYYTPLLPVANMTKDKGIRKSYNSIPLLTCNILIISV